MLASPTPSFLPADYYHRVADYFGCVLEAKQEIAGLSGEDYENWYYERCAFTYSLPLRFCYKGPKNIYRFGKAKQYASSDNVFRFYDAKLNLVSRYFPLLFREKPKPLNTRMIMKIIKENSVFWPLLMPHLQHVPARLYFARKMRVTKSNVMFFKQLETSRLDEQLEYCSQKAEDKRLYLAQQVNEFAEKLLIHTARFRDVKTNDFLITSQALSNPKRRFDPRRNPLDKPSHVGITIASLLHFPKLLARFEDELSRKPPGLVIYNSEVTSFENPTLSLTISALCIYPFTELDMNMLLLNLGAIAETPSSGAEKKFTVKGSLKGKAKGVISAFPAAFGVLSRANLFNPDKGKWSAATLATYAQELGKKVLSYEPDTMNDGVNGSSAFDKYTNKSQRWLHEWKANNIAKTGS